MTGRQRVPNLTQPQLSREKTARAMGEGGMQNSPNESARKIEVERCLLFQVATARCVTRIFGYGRSSNTYLEM